MVWRTKNTMSVCLRFKIPLLGKVSYADYLYMQDLSVDKLFIANKVKPGECLILLFNFSQILQDQDPDESVKSLRNDQPLRQVFLR